MKFLLGGLLIILAAVMMNLINGNWQFASLGVFMDAPSMLFMILSLSGVIVASGNWKLFVKAKKALFKKVCPLTHEERESAITLFKTLRKSSIYAGLIGSLIGILLMLGNLYDIEILAANLALSLLCLYYAFFINLVFFNPAIATLQKRNANE